LPGEIACHDALDEPRDREDVGGIERQKYPVDVRTGCTHDRKSKEEVMVGAPREVVVGKGEVAWLSRLHHRGPK
jgi:hypothetical protein